MRKILFKAKRIDNGEWVEGCLFFVVDTAYIICDVETVCMDGENTDLYATEWYEVAENTICQFTGLYDNTKWEDLTDEEKQEFYNENCSEDGRTIKYQRIEDVKHLWKGKKVWENDILKHGSRLFVVDYYKTFAMYMLKGIRCNGASHGMNTPIFESKVVGNIFDNPELLEGGAE